MIGSMPAAAVMAAERRVVKRLRNAGATNPNTAVPLGDLRRRIFGFEQTFPSDKCEGMAVSKHNDARHVPPMPSISSSQTTIRRAISLSSSFV